MTQVFRYMRDDERLVGTVTGSVDDDFEAQWLMDARHSFPAKKTGGLSLAVSGSAVMADTFVVVNHNIPGAGTAAFGAFATVTIPAHGSDGIARNGFELLGSPVSVGSFTFSTSGEVVGEIWVGPSHALTVDFLMGRQFDPGRPFRWETSLPPYDDGMSEPRRLSGRMVLDDEEYEDLVDWYTSTKKGKRPSIIIPDENVNDAWLAVWEFTEEHSEGYHFVAIEVLELPRTEW